MMAEQYNAPFTGAEIDAALNAVRTKETTWDGKQDKLTGTKGQVVGFDENGDAVPQDAPAGGEGGGSSGDVDLSAYAPKESPVFTGSISLGRKDESDVGGYSFAVGLNCIASRTCSHAEGLCTTASDSYSHAEGDSTTASAPGAHAEGKITIANARASHAEGEESVASGIYSHAEGAQTTASGSGAHAEGSYSVASGALAHAGNFGTIAAGNFQTAIGTYNVESVETYDMFIVGSGNSDHSRSNCFRVTHSGVFASGNYNASGADYAELFEWADGNPEGEDRCGRFVTLEGERIRLAGPGDSYILGVVSGAPSVVGDVYDDQWRGMYLYDIFGRPIWEDVEVPAETVELPDPDHPGETILDTILPACTERRQKLNPDYDPSKPYRPRTERPEWDAVGLVGKLVMVDDGSCVPDGYCTAGAGGAAAASEARTPFRVLSRLDETHIRVMLLPTQ